MAAAMLLRRTTRLLLALLLVTRIATALPADMPAFGAAAPMGAMTHCHDPVDGHDGQHSPSAPSSCCDHMRLGCACAQSSAPVATAMVEFPLSAAKVLASPRPTPLLTSATEERFRPPILG
jgi:hypothetical protein